MQSYEQYCIRCKSCGTPLDHLSGQFKQLVEKYHGEQLDPEQKEISANEKALRDLGIMNECCRFAMTTPTIVYFVMQKRAVIDGIVDARVASTIDDFQSPGVPVFTACGASPNGVPIRSREPTTPISSFLPPAPSVPVNANPLLPGILNTRIEPAQLPPISSSSQLPPISSSSQLPPISSSSPTLSSKSTLPSLSSIKSSTIAPITNLSIRPTVAASSSSSSSTPQVPGKLNLKPLNTSVLGSTSRFKSPLSASPIPSAIKPITETIELQPVSINIDAASPTFEIPTVPGMPTINKSDHPPSLVNVGAGYKTTLLTGRTYLAL